MSRLTPQYRRWLDELDAVCRFQGMDDWDIENFFNTEGLLLQKQYEDNKTPQEAYDWLNKKVV